MKDDLISLLSAHLPSVFRWAGALARQLRRHDIALGGKNSGFADTDALTLADLSVQELLVAALRDMGPTVRQCRIEAEEASGDLGRFADESEWVLGIDPIDGTREYRDRTGDGYAVMLHARRLALECPLGPPCSPSLRQVAEEWVADGLGEEERDFISQRDDRNGPTRRRGINFPGLREVVWVNPGTFGYDGTVRLPAACR